MDLLYLLLEWNFSVVRLVLWQLKSTYLLLECRSCVVGLVVWPVKYGVQSAGLGPTFCVTSCRANISGVLSDFSGTTTFFNDFPGAPSGPAITLFLFDV